MGSCLLLLKGVDMSTNSPPVILARRLDPEGKQVTDLVSAATYLGVSVQFLRRRIAEGRLPAHRVGRLIRVYVEDLEALRQPIGGAAL
jgi:excisionase family DNA binding protein